MHHLNYDWHSNFTPQERVALIPRIEVNPFTEQARKLVEWCNEPWLSEMDKARYVSWAIKFDPNVTLPAPLFLLKLSEANGDIENYVLTDLDFEMLASDEYD